MPSRSSRPVSRTVPSTDLPPRPEGEVLWVHATSTERYMALCDVGNRLKTARPDLSVLATWEPDMAPPPEAEGCDIPAGHLPPEREKGKKNKEK